MSAIDLKTQNVLTNSDTPEMSIALRETSSSNLSGVDTRNSGSQLLKLY